MQRLSGSAMHIGRKIGLNDEKGYLVPVAIALIVVIAVIAGFYIYFTIYSTPEEYNTMYLLDSQHQAIDYPQVLVAGHNSTFTVNVDVVNHMKDTHSYQVRTKIVTTFMLHHDGVDAPTIDTYDVTIEKGATNEHVATVTENTVGNYAVIFELWLQKADGSYEFTQNYCVLNIDVIN
jgi:uncharacterized membrane protein